MQYQLELGEQTGHGGRRPGAGRKRGDRRRVVHRRRDSFRNGSLHVTSRVAVGVPSLRRASIIRAIESSLRRGCERADFRVVHYSIQRDHVHWLVEANDPDALGRGMRSVLIRVAKAVNGTLGRRGPVFHLRYHAVPIQGPRQARACIAYVLNNARKHHLARRAGPDDLDPASSARWFSGWTRPVAPPLDAPAVARPRYWLFRQAWLRHGGIDPAEVPSAADARLAALMER